MALKSSWIPSKRWKRKERKRSVRRRNKLNWNSKRRRLRSKKLLSSKKRKSKKMIRKLRRKSSSKRSRPSLRRRKLSVRFNASKLENFSRKRSLCSLRKSQPKGIIIGTSELKSWKCHFQ